MLAKTPVTHWYCGVGFHALTLALHTGSCHTSTGVLPIFRRAVYVLHADSVCKFGEVVGQSLVCVQPQLNLYHVPVLIPV